MMKQAIGELLQDKGGNYILPFFWQHGEDEAVLRDYMRAIQASNIGAVCVEARPHPEYAGPAWWRDMDIILDEARQRGMKVWILDDAHFPTGQANGAMENADPALCKLYYDVKRADVSGPLPEATLDVAAAVKYQKPFSFAPKSSFYPEPRLFDDDALVAVLAAPLLEGNTIGADVLDLTPQVQDGVLQWDVPAGLWRLFVVIKTRNGGGYTHYINMLDKASCRVQIDAVYEPHWQHYGAEFGKTIAGFFSDEPCLGNVYGFAFDESIGRKIMPLPWSDAMPAMMEARLGKDYARLLPALWADMDDAALTGRVRYAYMDSVTRLVAENFSEQLGQWCAAHGVEYIGHLIEDNNAHARMGCSLGHFFRGMQGQHMAGIDDIGGQVLIGQEYSHRIRPAFLGGYGDGEFFHFALGKLGSSLGHIDPKKQGRTMCEAFGAYGWDEGLTLMKYITDHFLVRGVNVYVPHAFSPKAFPDPDCPPHFYAHGKNPQFTRFGALMKYMNRVCHLLQGGTHSAPVALLYHGEAEWAGEYMLLQKPARALMENQLDFDIVPSDVFADMDAFAASFDGVLRVNGEAFKALVIPYAQFLPKAVLGFAAKAAGKGFPVFFLNGLPEGVCDAADENAYAEMKPGLAAARVTSLAELPGELRRLGLADVTASQPFAGLRYYHYVKDGEDGYMVSNESAHETFEGSLVLSAKGNAVAYDAMNNRLADCAARPVTGGTEIPITLRPYESRLFIFAQGLTAGYKMPSAHGLPQKQSLSGWDVALCEAPEYPAFGEAWRMEGLESVAKKHPAFSGYIRYETSFIPLKTGGEALLVLEDAYEAPEVWLNGRRVGLCLAPPYEFDLCGLLQEGKNTLRVEVATTLFRQLEAGGKNTNMYFGSMLNVNRPTGLVGEANICYP